MPESAPVAERARLTLFSSPGEPSLINNRYGMIAGLSPSFQAGGQIEFCHDTASLPGMESHATKSTNIDHFRKNTHQLSAFAFFKTRRSMLKPLFLNGCCYFL